MLWCISADFSDYEDSFGSPSPAASPRCRGGYEYSLPLLSRCCEGVLYDASSANGRAICSWRCSQPQESATQAAEDRRRCNGLCHAIQSKRWHRNRCLGRHLQLMTWTNPEESLFSGAEFFTHSFWMGYSDCIMSSYAEASATPSKLFADGVLLEKTLSADFQNILTITDDPNISTEPFWLTEEVIYLWSDNFALYLTR